MDLVGRDNVGEDLLPADEQKPHDVGNKLAVPSFHEAERLGQLLVGELKKAPVPMEADNLLTHPFELQGVEVGEGKLVEHLGGKIEEPKIHPSRPLVPGVERYTLRLAVRLDGPMQRLA